MKAMLKIEIDGKLEVLKEFDIFADESAFDAVLDEIERDNVTTLDKMEKREFIVLSASMVLINDKETPP